LRSLAPWKADWLLGGLLNGNASHTADNDPALLCAAGFVR